jgi:hypothetical protein
MANLRPQHALDNRANQLNPAHPLYYRSRGIGADKALSRAIQERRSHERISRPGAHPDSRAVPDSQGVGPAARALPAERRR